MGGEGGIFIPRGWNHGHFRKKYLKHWYVLRWQTQDYFKFVRTGHVLYESCFIVRVLIVLGILYCKDVPCCMNDHV
jgi:hypothetical protein